MEILINNKVQKMVQALPPTDPTAVTDFDIFMHLTLLNATDYNAL